MQKQQRPQSNQKKQNILTPKVSVLKIKSTEIIATWFKKEISANICHVRILYYKIISQNCALNSLEPKECDFYTVGGGINK